AIHDIISTLEAGWRLGLRVRDGNWSPSQSDKSRADRINGYVKRLYYTNRSALDRCLKTFNSIAGGQPTAEARLGLLDDLLRAECPTPRVAGQSGTHTPRDDPPKFLRSPLCTFRSSIWLLHETPRALQGSDRHAYSFSLHTSTDGPSASTTDDEDEYVPPSPTLSSFSAQRRVQASPRVSLGPAGRKRSSESSGDATSPKFSRIGSRRMSRAINDTPFAGSSRFPADMTPIPFKKPTLDMANSLKPMTQTPFVSKPVQAPSTNPSAQTSFSGSTILQSSQESAAQHDTRNTSFSSDVFGDDPAKITRPSSATIGSSLDDEDLLEVAHRVETLLYSEDMTRESSSYGAISSQVLVETVIRHEERVGLSHKDPAPKATSQSRKENARPRRPPQEAAHPASSSKFDLPPLSNDTSIGLPSLNHINESPGKISHHIRNLPEQNLFVDQVQTIPSRLPYFILFICCRVAMTTSGDLEEVLSDVENAWSSSETFWNKIKGVYSNIKMKESQKIWSAWKRDLDGYTFRGKVVFNQRQNGPLFKLELQPLHADISSRFQRAWGTDRFLYLDLPAFDSNSIPQRFRAFRPHVLEYWKKWYCSEHSFLGRKWRAFDLKPIKKANNSAKNDDKYDKKMILFATEGVGIDRPCSIGELLNWFMPFAHNDEQSFCKAYARFDLGLSRTLPTLVFKPSQVEYVADIVADGTPEATVFDDTLLPWNEQPEENQVMNDGCCVMSVGAAQEIWRAYRKATNTNDPMPSVFQGRIGGAKGLWMVSAESYSKDPTHTQIWIKINESQLKFQPHPEDYFDESYDPHRLTFELCNYSSPPVASDLHISFISIMTDRGVPKEVISKLMSRRLDIERAQLLEMLPDPVKMYNWAHKQSSSGSRNEDDVRWQAALPHSLGEKVRLLLEAGFAPTKSPYLARCLQRFIEKQQLWREKKLRTPLGKATYLYGVADPYGVLAPGEVHVQFSTSFIDDTTDERYLCLDAINLLVARQPACRRSDIQKVRSIVHPRLTHLVDVVVFPSKGQFPLAGKLQGGDYDGDIFWLCWEDALVAPFKNAPAPLHSPAPGDYGIKQDKRKVKEIMNPRDLTSVDALIEQVLEFRMNPSLLGIVTNFLEKRAYLENRIHSEVLDRLCDMHDLLVDAPKNGYSFSDSDFRTFVTETLGLSYQPKVPAYKKAMEACENAREMGEAEKVRKQVWPHNAENVLDHLYFSVIHAHNVDTLDMVLDLFKNARDDDEHLRYPCKRLQDQGSPIVVQQMKALNVGLEKVYRKWNGGMHTSLSSDQYNTLVDACYKMYRELAPVNIDHPEIKPWIEPYLFEKFSIWETLRASALYTKYPGKAPFVFHMTGRELAHLKAQSNPGTRSIVAAIHANTKPKPIKPPSAFEDEDDEDFEAL
ncbi:hypothetical protein P154DRAFT_412766, partial [Amniculicola lignicola CBS 123094]